MVFTSSFTLDSITRGTGIPMLAFGEMVFKVSFVESCLSVSFFFGKTSGAGGLGFGLAGVFVEARGFEAGGLFAWGFEAGGFVAVAAGFFGAVAGLDFVSMGFFATGGGVFFSFSARNGSL